MIIGVPSEVKTDEYRVALTPAGVRELTSAGHTVYVEKGAGDGSSMPDAEFVRTGAKIVGSAPEVWAAADLVCKVKEPLRGGVRPPGPARRPDALHLSASRRVTRSARRRWWPPATWPSPTRRCARRTTRSRCLAPMSEVAGRMAPLMGAHHLMRPGGGRGVLVCGVPGVRSARVVILGAGVAGMAAATMAVGMHSEVFILDRNLDKLREVDHHFRGALETVASSEHAIEEVCLEADIVIGAVLVVGARAPRLVSDALVEQMRHGSVLVDISVDQGGCFESTRPTTHSNPTFEVHGSIFYCVANMPGAVPHTSTHALANATLPYTLGDRQPGLEARGPGRPCPGRGGERGRGPCRVPTGGRGPRDGLHAPRGAIGLIRPVTGKLVEMADRPVPEQQPPPGRRPAPAERVADADRDRTVTLLREHVVEGRLTLDEFSERTGRALEARTRGELDAVMADLPVARRARAVLLARPVAGTWPS